MWEWTLVSLCTIDLREWSRMPECNEKTADEHDAIFAENRLEHRGKRAGARLQMRREAGLPIADLTASNPTRCGFKYDSFLCLMRLPIRAPSTTIRSPAAC